MVKLKSQRRITYGVMVRVAFSPSDMGADEREPRIPSSQPTHRISLLSLCQKVKTSVALRGGTVRTSYNAANPNFGVEIAATHRRIEPKIDTQYGSRMCSPIGQRLTGAYCVPLLFGVSSL